MFPNIVFMFAPVAVPVVWSTFGPVPDVHVAPDVRRQIVRPNMGVSPHLGKKIQFDCCSHFL